MPSPPARSVPAADGVLGLLDPATLSSTGRVDLLVALEWQAASIAGLQLRGLSSLAVDQDDWVREDIACALRLSGMTAQKRLAVAQVLTGRLPATLRLVDRGEITYLDAAFLAGSVLPLDDTQTRAVEERVLPRAPEQTLAEFTRSVRRALASVTDVEQQRAEAMTQRRVCVTPRDDGMAELWAFLPAEGAAAVLAAELRP